MQPVTNTTKEKRELTKEMMPDVACNVRTKIEGTLDWVGMGEIDQPVELIGADGKPYRTGARIQAFVNLIDPLAKGIHMSRLYLALDEILATNPLNGKTLQQLLNQFVSSHEGLSNSGFLEFRFDYLVRRPSLKSEFSGWKNYPIKVIAQLIDSEMSIELTCEIPYSSTCPCSAALARQLIQQQFLQDFDGKEQLSVDQVHQWLGNEEGIVATPHSQRSLAQIKTSLSDLDSELPILHLINVVEESLKTAVQTAVKREDEQEFALLNGQNLMFCEDAARRIQQALNEHEEMFNDYWLRVDHLESLHAHDAVSIVTKGVPGGYRPNP